MSDRRALANRTNASKSTGPRTENGKETANRNAFRHGLRSQKILLEDEDPTAFEQLQSDLFEALRPVGAIEFALAERIVTAVWRQHRLERAESAAIAIERRPSEIVEQLQRLHDYGERDGITEDSLEAYDEEQFEWCRAVVEEIQSLAERSLTEVEQSAPLVWAQIKSDADEDQETPETYVDSLGGGLSGYLTELSLWCHREISAAKKRPGLLHLAAQLRERNFVLPSAQLEVFARYQTTLDNQLYKALRAFREAQEWRLKTLDGSGGPRFAEDLVTDAA